jgi:hypothetical protein
MSPKGNPRELRFSVLMTEEERNMLTAIAEAEHRSAGDWLRVQILTEYRTRFGDKKPKRKRR